MLFARREARHLSMIYLPSLRSSTGLRGHRGTATSHMPYTLSPSMIQLHCNSAILTMPRASWDREGGSKSLEARPLNRRVLGESWENPKSEHGRTLRRRRLFSHERGPKTKLTASDSLEYKDSALSLGTQGHEDICAETRAIFSPALSAAIRSAGAGDPTGHCRLLCLSCGEVDRCPKFWLQDPGSASLHRGWTNRWSSCSQGFVPVL